MSSLPKTQMPISIFDGRYSHQCQELCKFFTEETYTQVRYDIELAWLRTLVDQFHTGQDTPGILAELARLQRPLTHENLAEIKKLEQTTNHDVKAIELFIKHQINNLAQESNA
jgi:adenylosuccinate lyase